MDILKGFIKKTFTSDGFLKAQIEAEGSDIEDVLLVFPYGFKSNPPAAIEGALALLLISRGLTFAMPINPVLEPELESNEASSGNFKDNNKITFKSNGDIEIQSDSGTLKEIVDKLETTASTSITMTAPTIDLGDAVDLVLNQSAVMQVTIPGGSSAGTYPVTITSAGQTKVNA